MINTKNASMTLGEVEAAKKELTAAIKVSFEKFYEQTGIWPSHISFSASSFQLGNGAKLLMDRSFTVVVEL